jgi:lysophospholipase L1-like esterase
VRKSCCSRSGLSLAKLLLVLFFLFNSLAFSQYRVLPLGNSITYGELGSEGGYRDDLASMLNNAGINFVYVGSQVDTAGNHEGHRGYKTTDIDANLNDWLSQSNPDVVLLHIGTNDVSALRSTTDIINDISSILDKIYNNNNSSIIFLCSIIPRNDSKNSNTIELNNAIPPLIQDKESLGYKIHHVNQYDAFTSNSNWATEYMANYLHPNDTGYHVMADTYFNAMVTVLNLTGPVDMVDDFERSELGSKWAAGSEFKIISGRLSNTASDNDWGHLATYNGQVNPTKVSLKWASNADAAGINEGGLALMLDSHSPGSNGYLVWRQASSGKILLWTIENGQPGHSVTESNGLLSAPSAGDEFTVIMSSDGGGHHFKCYLNNSYDGMVSDPAKQQGNASQRFSGVMLRGGLNNDVEYFTNTGGSEGDNVPPAEITDLATATTTESSIQLTWTAPGDDGNVGTASSYDLRYSMNPIDANNFNDAIRVTNVKKPASAGNVESFTVTNLQPITTYYFAIKTLDEYSNTSPISNTVAAKTRPPTGLTSIDNFNRSDLGTDWVADPEFRVVNNELANTSPASGWDYMAVYRAQNNPFLVSFKWGVNADAAGIDEGGFALMLDAASTNANGYLLWRHTSSNKIDLWTIKNGAPASGIGQANASGSAPKSGDEVSVYMSTDETGHHFDVYINDQFDGRISDTNKQQGNVAQLYAGVMLRGGRNNNIDDFKLVGGAISDDQTPPAAISDLLVDTVTDSTVKLEWTATGDDGTQGTATSYDLRYSLNPITEANFLNATGVSGLPAPSIPGTLQSFVVTGLNPGKLYYFAIKVIDEAGNSSPISNLVSESTQFSGFVLDNFNRSDLGSNWVADPEYKIVNNELANTSTVSDWDFLAVYAKLSNPSQASFTWGASANQAGIDEGGFALRLNNASPTASGYLLWRHTTSNKIDLWTIENGRPGRGIGQTTALLSPPQAGATFKVIMSSDESGHHFDCFLNGEFDGRITDTNKEQGNVSTLYSGVMLKGNLSNNIDNFTISRGSSFDDTPPSTVTNLAIGTVTRSSVQLTWTAPGDDGLSGNASSYDLRYSTSPITDATFSSATKAVGVGKPSAPGTQELFEITGLAPNSKYYFALKTADEAANVSGISNIATTTTLTDAIAPATVTDLTVISTSAISATLLWTAPGNDGMEGTAAQYDLRYSTSPINESNFNSAVQVHNIFQPSSPGSQENFVVTGLETGTTYYFALKTSDESGNLSGISNVVSTTTVSGVTVVDDFNRSDLGAKWTVGPGYRIVSGELANTSTTDAWDCLAVYNDKKNPIEVSFKWGFAADAAGINGGGLALMLDSPSTNANGYFLWRHTNYNKIDLWTIENCVPGQGIAQANGSLSAPKAGDIFKVVMKTDASGHHFDCYINNILDGTISDVNKVKGNSSSLYAGVMLAGNKNNNIDDFTLTVLVGSPAELVKNRGDGQTGAAKQTLPLPLEVIAYDNSHNPIAKVPVIFTVTQGGGTLDGNVDSVKTIQTGSDGKASVSFTLGRNSVVQKVQAISVGLSPVTFSATASSGVATNLVYVSGANQSGTVGSTLTNPFVVRVIDEPGSPMSGIPVMFSITQGGGSTGPSITNTIQSTNSNGVASTLLTLGTQAGTHKVQAAAPGLSGSPYTFTATALADKATKLVEVSGNNQSGKGGMPLPSAFVVKVVDKYNNPKAGVPITFTVTKGGGELSATNVSTDDAGLASTLLTLGTESDTNKVVAASTGLTGSPIEFVAYTTSGVASGIAYVSGNNQTGTVKTVLPNPLKVKIVDKNNQPVQYHDVRFKTVTGQGGLNGSTDQEKVVPTNSDGIAQVNVTLGDDLSIIIGPTIIEATSAKTGTPLQNSPIRFTATAVVPNLSEVSGNNQSGVAGEPLPQPFVVKVTDEANRPIASQKVLFSVTEGGGNIEGKSQKETLSQGDGTASVIFTLGPLDGQSNNVVVSANYKDVPLDGSGIIFKANSGAVSDLKIISGYNQVGSAGQVLANPFRVRVLTDLGAPVKNYPVTFTVSKGGGSLADSQIKNAKTNDNGYAEAYLTLGPMPGDTNKVRVEAFGQTSPLSGSPAEFKAVAAVIKDIKGISGNAQTGTVASVLPLPFKVKITDMINGAPKGFPVTFAVEAGGGSFNGAATTVASTGADGIAQAFLKLGPVPGTNNNIAEACATFNSEPVFGSPVVFTASATVGEPAHLVYVDGDSQSSVIGNKLQPLKVKITDGSGNPISNHPVTFTVTAGGGSLDEGEKTSVTKLTNAMGIAQAEWTLGTTVGENNNIVECTSTNNGAPLTGSPLRFKATALPSSAEKIQMVSGNLQEGAAGRALSQPFKVLVTDNDGIPIASHPVEFRVVAGGGTLDGSADTSKTVNTEADGIAQVTLTLGRRANVDNITYAISANGPNPLSGSPRIFTARSKPGAVDPDVSVVTASPESLRVGESAKAEVSITLTDTFGNPIAGKQVTVLSSRPDDIIEQPAELTNSLGQTSGTISSVYAGIRLLSAKDVTDNIDLVNKSTIKFLPSDASAIKYVSGNDQRGNVGTALHESIVVKITDEFGNAKLGYPVRFEVLSGGGSIFEKQPVMSNSSGEASATFILGEEVGSSNVATARAEGLQGASVSFIATAVEGVASRMSMVSGSGQSGHAGAPLKNPFVVAVVGQDNMPVFNYPVEFEVTGGNGSFYGGNAKIIKTDFRGYASAQMVLDSQIGVNTAVANAAGLTGSPITFTAMGQIGLASRLLYVAGDSQAVAVDEQVPVPLMVKVTDFYNNGIGDHPVLFEVKEGDAELLQSQIRNTDDNGLVTMPVLVGSKAGKIVIEAVSEDLINSPIDFAITALASAPTSMALLSGNNQNGTTGRSLPFLFEVLITDFHANPVSGANVNWGVIEGGGSFSQSAVTKTDEKGIAKNFLILGSNTGTNSAYASISGLQGSPVNFTAQAVTNKFPTLSSVGNRSVNEGETVAFQLSATDEDGSVRQYGARNLPRGAVFDSTGNHRFSWTPDFQQAGDYELIFLAYDNEGGIGSEYITIKVNNINHKPEITNFIPDESSVTLFQSTQDTVRFEVIATDADLEPLQYKWLHTAFGVTVLGSTKPFYDLPALGNLNGVHDITVQVSDGIDVVHKTWYINIRTLVELISFTADVIKYKGVKLEWQTAEEINTAGFNLLKSMKKDGTYEQVNSEMIAPNSDKVYQYIDSEVENGKSYYYKLEDIDKNGSRVQHDPILVTIKIPDQYELMQNYPNPFNPSTQISFQLPKNIHATLKIYNVMGQEIRTLVDNVKVTGFHTILWDGQDDNGQRVPSGIYFYCLRTKDFKETKRMLLVR